MKNGNLRIRVRAVCRGMSLAAALVAALIVIGSRPVQASTTLSLGGGTSFGGGDAFTGVSSPSLLLNGELTFGVGDVFQLGGLFDRNSLKYGPFSSDLNFYGAVARLGFGMVSAIFLDAKLGLDTATNTDSVFGFGAGIGYQLSLGPFLSLKPRVGYRSLPAKVGSVSTSGHTIDTDVLLSFSL